jgi:hypothetical protein
MSQAADSGPGGSRYLVPATNRGLRASKLRLINHAFVVVQRAFRPILAADLGHRHATDDGVDPRTNIGVRTVRRQCDLIADRELVLGQIRPSGNTLGAAHEAPPGMSARLKIDGRGLTLLSTLQFKADRLTLIEGLEPGAFDSRDMDEHVL